MNELLLTKHEFLLRLGIEIIGIMDVEEMLPTKWPMPVNQVGVPYHTIIEHLEIHARVTVKKFMLNGNVSNLIVTSYL